MECFGRVGPEVELHVRIVSSLLGARLLRVDEVRELDGVLDEEHGGVIAHNIVVAFCGVDLESEASWVSVAVVGASHTGNGGESQEAGRLLANLVKEGGFSELG